MDKRKNNDYDWDDRYYGTGPTEPPKNRGAMVALLLVLVIFLCGIVSVLGILNIRLFQKLNVEEPKQELAISFTTEATEAMEEVQPEIAETQIPKTASAG